MIEEQINVGMFKDGKLICEFKNLREASKCLVAFGVVEKYTTAKTGISKVANKYKNSVSYLGFFWEYMQCTPNEINK